MADGAQFSPPVSPALPPAFEMFQLAFDRRNRATKLLLRARRRLARIEAENVRRQHALEKALFLMSQIAPVSRGAR